MSTEQKANFEQFFEAQSFFPKLKYIHGERLFDCDEIDGAITYRNLTVNACWATWLHLSNMEQCYIEKKKQVEGLQGRIRDQIDVLKAASKSHAYNYREQNIMLSQADDLEKALRGNP